MIKTAIVLVATLLLASFAFSQTSAPASTQPAVSEPVRANGVDFQLVLAPETIVPTADHPTTIPLALRLTNRTDSKVQLKIIYDLQFILQDVKGTKIQLGDLRDETLPDEPIDLKPGETRDLDFTARLDWKVSQGAGRIELSIPDRIGGTFITDALDVGAYTLSVAIPGIVATKPLPLRIISVPSARIEHGPGSDILFAATQSANGNVKIVVSGKNAIITVSGGAFPVRDAMWELTIGDQKTHLSRYPDSGMTDTLIFFMPIDAFNKTKDGDAISVSGGTFAGTLDKSTVLYQK